MSVADVTLLSPSFAQSLLNIKQSPIGKHNLVRGKSIKINLECFSHYVVEEFNPATNLSFFNEISLRLYAIAHCYGSVYKLFDWCSYVVLKKCEFLATLQIVQFFFFLSFCPFISKIESVRPDAI
jgi:hypothetical protein